MGLRSYLFGAGGPTMGNIPPYDEMVGALQGPDAQLEAQLGRYVYASQQLKWPVELVEAWRNVELLDQTSKLKAAERALEGAFIRRETPPSIAHVVFVNAFRQSRRQSQQQLRPLY